MRAERVSHLCVHAQGHPARLTAIGPAEVGTTWLGWIGDVGSMQKHGCKEGLLLRRLARPLIRPTARHEQLFRSTDNVHSGEHHVVRGVTIMACGGLLVLMEWE
jgi:hypothetical protein